MNQDLYIYYYVIEKQTKDRVENRNQHSTRAPDRLLVTGAPQRETAGR